MSVQIVVTDPRVSTASSFLTSPCLLSMPRMPSTRIIVTAINNPSGIAAMARTILVLTISNASKPEMTPVTNMPMVIATTM